MGHIPPDQADPSPIQPVSEHFQDPLMQLFMGSTFSIPKLEAIQRAASMPQPCSEPRAKGALPSPLPEFEGTAGQESILSLKNRQFLACHAQATGQPGVQRPHSQRKSDLPQDIQPEEPGRAGFLSKSCSPEL